MKTLNSIHLKECLLEHGAVFAALYILVTLLSWPLGWDNTLLASSLLEGDIGYTIFIQWWTAEHLFDASALSRNIHVQYPIGTDAVRYLFNLPVLLLTIPFQWMFEPIQAYNQSILFLLSLNGWAGYVFGKRWGKTTGWLCAIALCALPFPWHELGKGRLEQGFLLPLLCWTDSLFDLRETRQWKKSGFWLAVVTNCYWFYAPMALVLLPFVLGRQIGTYIGTILKMSGLCLVLCLPQVWYIWPLIEQMQQSHAFDNPDYLIIQMENSWWPLHSFPYTSLYRAGHLPILLGGLLLWSPNRKTLLLLLSTIFILAMGPFLLYDRQPLELWGQAWSLPQMLLNQLPFYRRFYWPYRWLVLLAPLICLAIASLKLQTKWSYALMIGMIIEIWILLPVGYDPHKNTLSASTYALPKSGRFVSYEPSDFWSTLPNTNKALLTLPRTLTDQNLDLQVLDIVHHQRPISNSLEEIERNKLFKQFANQDPGGFYENWLLMKPLCRSDWDASEDFLVEQDFGWVVWYKSRMHNNITPRNYQCLETLLGEPTYQDSQVSAWKIES